MRKTILASAIAAAFVFTACGTSSGSSTYNETPDNYKSTTVYSGGGDVDISDVVVGENGTYINNGDGTLTFIGGDTGADNAITVDGSHGGTGPDGNSSAYDPNNFSTGLSQSECTALGFFYCTLEHKCLNKPASGSTCPARK